MEYMEVKTPLLSSTHADQKPGVATGTPALPVQWKVAAWMFKPGDKVSLNQKIASLEMVEIGKGSNEHMSTNDPHARSNGNTNTRSVVYVTSPCSGRIDKVFFEPNQIIPSPQGMGVEIPLAIISYCSHPMMYSGMCALCGEEETREMRKTRKQPTAPQVASAAIANVASNGNRPQPLPVTSNLEAISSSSSSSPLIPPSSDHTMDGAKRHSLSSTASALPRPQELSLRAVLPDASPAAAGYEHRRVEVAYAGGEISVSMKEAERIGQSTARRLLSEKRLSLVLDLDHTLLHATNDDRAKAALEYIEHGKCENGVNLADIEHLRKDIKTFPIPEANGTMYVKLRPGLMEFLEKMKQLFELHIYTMGTRMYADSIARAIDPGGEIFQSRIVSREDFAEGALNQKNLRRVFPCDDSMVLVVDDREDVWVQEREPSDLKGTPSAALVPSVSGSGIAIPSTTRPRLGPLKERSIPNLIRAIPYVFFSGLNEVYDRTSVGFQPPNGNSASRSPNVALTSTKGANQQVPDMEEGVSGNHVVIKDSNGEQVDVAAVDEPQTILAKHGLGTEMVDGKEDADDFHIPKRPKTSPPIMNGSEPSPVDLLAPVAALAALVGDATGANANGADVDAVSIDAEAVAAPCAGSADAENAAATPENSTNDLVAPLQQTTTTPSCFCNLVKVWLQADRRDQRHLARIGEILTECRRRFFEQAQDMNIVSDALDNLTPGSGTGVSTGSAAGGQKSNRKRSMNSVSQQMKLPSRSALLLSNNPRPDVKFIMDEIRHSVLKSCKLAFTGVIPSTIEKEHTYIWWLADRFGAVIVDTLDPTVTHLIADEIRGKETQKTKDALTLGSVFIVTPRWLEYSCANFLRASELEYALLGKLNLPWKEMDATMRQMATVQYRQKIENRRMIILEEFSNLSMRGNSFRHMQSLNGDEIDEEALARVMERELEKIL